MRRRTNPEPMGGAFVWSVRSGAATSGGKTPGTVATTPQDATGAGTGTGSAAASPVSASGSAPEKSKDASSSSTPAAAASGSKEKDKERERRALLSDTELNAIRRNAVQLLELHEAFFNMLSDAIHASGWSAGINALEGSGELGSELPCTDSEETEQRFETALRSVATLFTAQVSGHFFVLHHKLLRVCVHSSRGSLE